MCGNVSILHRTVLVLGIIFQVPLHGLINSSVNEGGCTLTHAFSVILYDGTLLGGDTDFYLNETGVIFFVSSLTGFC